MSELTTLFKNTADAIRSKTGDTATMKASQFPAKIQGISVGISQDEADARYLRLSGGTMTGPLVLSGAPTANNQAATKAYVDSKSGSELILAESDFNLTAGADTPMQFVLDNANLLSHPSVLLKITGTGGGSGSNYSFIIKAYDAGSQFVNALTFGVKSRATFALVLPITPIPFSPSGGSIGTTLRATFNSNSATFYAQTTQQTSTTAQNTIYLSTNGPITGHYQIIMK